jgi:hypothetical protein
VEYLRRNTAVANVIRLIAVLLIAMASIVCIALDRDRAYFTNVLTLVIGIIVDSPLSLRKNSSSAAPPHTEP